MKRTRVGETFEIENWVKKRQNRRKEVFNSRSVWTKMVGEEGRGGLGSA